MRHDDRIAEDDLLASAMSPIASRVLAGTPVEGSTSTAIPFLSLTRRDRPTELARGVLTPSVCLVVQGRKRVEVRDEVIGYGAGNYLASTLDMPAAGNVVTASRGRPYLGLRLEIGADEVAAVVMDAKIELTVGGGAVGVTFIGEADLDLLGAVGRLLHLLDRPRDAAFLAPALKREIIYRLLTGRSGHAFHRNVMLDRRALGIGKAMQWLKDNFDRRIKIDELARATHMSVSSLQHKFKAVTAMGPLQYQKRLRLEEARRRLLRGGADATSTAFAVGYESASQFSREYRRLFGVPPSQHARIHAGDARGSEL
jgi:AraC-like DNA-binding protein